MVKSKLHGCENCNAGFSNKKELVKHTRTMHPVKKDKKPNKSNRLRFCPIKECTWKSSTGGYSYHMNVHHERAFKFQKKEYLKDAKRVCILCPKAEMSYNSYSHHLFQIHEIKLAAKSRLD
jgi:hypothetical protein